MMDAGCRMKVAANCISLTAPFHITRNEETDVVHVKSDACTMYDVRFQLDTSDKLSYFIKGSICIAEFHGLRHLEATLALLVSMSVCVPPRLL